MRGWNAGSAAMALALSACARNLPAPALDAGPLDVVLVPGCPSRDDGTLSGCQWARVLWAHRVWEQGHTRALLTSGNAVYNRFVEAEALKAGLVALGVPEHAVHTETQALHSDENAAYALPILAEHGWTRVGVASHAGHARGIRAFLVGWGTPALALPMDEAHVRARQAEPLPDVRTEPVPEREWLPLKERERVLAARLDRARRPHSVFVYTWAAVRGTFGTSRPPLPPVREPTLDGRRHRVDTAAW